MNLSADVRTLVVEAGRIFRFGLVGMCVTLVYVLASTVANEVFGVSPVLAAIVGQASAIGVSYVGHSSFSFRVTTNHRVFLWRYMIIVLLTLAIAMAVTWLLTDVEGLSPRIAAGTVAVLNPIINYLCNRFWVFRQGLDAVSMVSTVLPAKFDTTKK